MIRWGDYLSSLFAKADTDILIVAPFIRSYALTKLLKNVCESVHISIVTRWRPEDILSGVSDLKVFDLAESRSISLFLCNDLHAKLFIADDQCIVGSANVTETALGWRHPANLELLVTVDRSSSRIQTFLTELMAASVRATIVHRNHLLQLTETLNVNQRFNLYSRGNSKESAEALSTNWVPQSMNPEELYAVYIQGSSADVGRMVLPDMLEDLSKLDVPPGLTESEFKLWVASIILQTPLVVGVLDSIETQGSISEDALAELFRSLGIDLDTNSPQDGLKTLQRWLSFFLPNEYETAPASIKLIRTTLKGIDLLPASTNKQQSNL